MADTQTDKKRKGDALPPPPSKDKQLSEKEIGEIFKRFFEKYPKFRAAFEWGKQGEDI